MTDGTTISLATLIALRAHSTDLVIGTNKRVTQPTTGGYRTRFRGRGMDFSEVRAYQAGDDIRHMDWRVTARLNKPAIKIYEEERDRAVFLVVDQSSSMQFASRVAFKSVLAAQIAALLAWAVTAHGDKLGGIIFSEQAHSEFRPAQRQQAVLAFLKGLVDFCNARSTTSAQQSTTQSLTAQLQRLRRVARHGALIIVISDFYNVDQSALAELSRLREHNDVLTIRLRDPLELHAPQPARYGITNGEQRFDLDLRQVAVQQAYETYFNEHTMMLTQALQRLQIPLLEVMTNSQYQQILRQYFGGVRSHARSH